MKKENFQKKSDADLKKAVEQNRSALRDFRFSGAGGRTRNVREGRTLRRDIARILTELTRRTRA